MLLMVKSSHTAVNFLRDSFLFRERRGKRSEHILLFQEIVGEDSVKYWVRKQEEGGFRNNCDFFREYSSVEPYFRPAPRSHGVKKSI